MARASTTVSFADVAHQTLIFDGEDEADQLVLRLIDTKWVQRLRAIRQTGNTNLVYMFSEHSRFGHSLGVAYLALSLMRKLERAHAKQIAPYKKAVAAAALLHDVGHVAPGSHLAERIWCVGDKAAHEHVTTAIIGGDREIQEVLSEHGSSLASDVVRILQGDSTLPPWTVAVISGGGWNADRGNWAIVDSAMCSVSYGRYNVSALIDAFCLTDRGELALRENRLDALTHFFVARDSMYRQVYQHRVLQVADLLTELAVKRIRELCAGANSADKVREALQKHGVFVDETMAAVLVTDNYARELPFETVFEMTESWWGYHLHRWCLSSDPILRDLAQRVRDRRLFKTIRVDKRSSNDQGAVDTALSDKAQAAATAIGLDPRYYVATIENADRHRGEREEAPLVVLDNGEVVPVTEVEPLIAELFERSPLSRTWLAVPKEIKDRLGRLR